MTKFAIPALAAALALGACAEADAPAADDGENTTTIVQPTETTVVEQPAPVDGEEGSSLTIDGGDVDATISEDGVQAEINVD